MALLPFANNAGDGGKVPIWPFNAKRVARELKAAAPKVEAAVKALEDAKRVTQKDLEMEFTI